MSDSEGTPADMTPDGPGPYGRASDGPGAGDPCAESEQASREKKKLDRIMRGLGLDIGQSVITFGSAQSQIRYPRFAAPSVDAPEQNDRQKKAEPLDEPSDDLFDENGVTREAEFLQLIESFGQKALAEMAEDD